MTKYEVLKVQRDSVTGVRKDADVVQYHLSQCLCVTTDAVYITILLISSGN